MRNIAYATDLYGWAITQAAALRAVRRPYAANTWNTLDLEHLAEEIEALGHEQEHAVESHLRNVLHHLLKWHHQPRRRTRSWRASLRNSRIEIRHRLQRNPSLRPKLQDLANTAYADARKLAMDETGLPLNTFPSHCPWTLAQIQDEDFLPPASA
jgi:hypothetical protein